MELIHYSNKPICFDPHHKFLGMVGAFKPAGFWVSVKGEMDWPEWCRDNKYNVAALKYPHEVSLKSTAKVLVVSTLEELDAFHKRFIGNNVKFYEIDWDAVKNEFDGLIISPYQWERRFEHGWYYGWDCASGVIWNLNVIENVVLKG